MIKWLALALFMGLALGWGCVQFQSQPQKAPPTLLEPGLWEEFRHRFVEPSGRVVDPENADISHSEGQGYAMLMAEAAGDRAGFQLVWEWAARVLWRDDHLFSWRYEPCPFEDRRCVTDHNNATDGEILIAWALLRAHARWGDADHRQAAVKIHTALLRDGLILQDGAWLILPGREGFIEESIVTVNGSYWVFPALEAFERHFHEPRWRQVIESGRRLLEEARFGPYRLHADWTDTGGPAPVPSAKFDAVHGFDAVRIPLHLAWSEDGIRRSDLRGYRDFWHDHTPPPAWIDLQGKDHAEYSRPTGMEAIARLAAAHADSEPITADALPVPGDADGYFSWALTLLSRIAAAERAT